MSMTILRILVGMGSNSHDLEAELMILLRVKFVLLMEKQSKGDPQNTCRYLRHHMVEIVLVRNLPRCLRVRPCYH